MTHQSPFSEAFPDDLDLTAFVDALIRQSEVQDGLATPPPSLFSEREIGELVRIVTAYARSEERQRAA